MLLIKILIYSNLISALLGLALERMFDSVLTGDSRRKTRFNDSYCDKLGYIVQWQLFISSVCSRNVPCTSIHSLGWTPSVVVDSAHERHNHKRRRVESDPRG